MMMQANLGGDILNLGTFVEFVIKQKHEIQKFKKQMKETEGLFLLHMTIITQN